MIDWLVRESPTTRPDASEVLRSTMMPDFLPQAVVEDETRIVGEVDHFLRTSCGEPVPPKLMDAIFLRAPPVFPTASQQQPVLG